MATYQDLRDRALAQVSAVGQTEAQTVAQQALEEAMKFVAFHVRIPTLIAKATATAGASPDLESNAIAIETTGFSVTAGQFQVPDRLYVKKDSGTVEIGTPYDFFEYHHFQDLKNAPSETGMRYSIYTPWSMDERSNFSWTITPDKKVWATPLAQNNVLTLYYRKVPAVYGASTVPEIDTLFDHILVNGAVLALKEYLREPAEVSTMWGLFEAGLMRDIERYDNFLNGQRKRSRITLHRSYRIY